MGKPRARRLVLWFGLILLTLAVAGLIVRILATMVFDADVAPEVEFRLPADQLFTILGFPVTNTLLSSWAATLLLVALFAAARWRARLAPRGLQNLTERVLDILLEYVIGIAGRERAPKLFAIAATLFLFIMVNAWITVLPWYGPVEAVRGDGSRVPLFRGAGTDINMSLALALVGGTVVELSGLMALRTSYFRRFFRVGNLLRGRLIFGMVDLFTGMVEAMTEAARVFSFSFRLFGSLTAGEMLVVFASFLTPLVLTVPFYGLELLIGIIQAWIFASLTVLFAVHAMTPVETELLEGPHA